MAPIALLAALVLQQQAVPAQRTADPPAQSAAVVPNAGAHRHSDGRDLPVVTAVHVSTGAPRIDGNLDDAVWAQAEAVSGFTQRYPQDGQPASQRTEVRLAYDSGALYVAARMYDTVPGGGADDDHFEFAIDSEHDHSTAFFFKVNPLGVRNAAVIVDDGANQDTTWNPAWDVVTRRDSLGWTAECRIPYTQLRVANAETQVWGVNFNRHVGRTGEDAFWARIGEADSGYASFFGHLVGIADLPNLPRLKSPPPR